MRAMKRYIIKDMTGKILLNFSANDFPDQTVIGRYGGRKGREKLESTATISFGEEPITNSASMELTTSPIRRESIKTMMRLREEITARSGFKWKTINWDEVKFEPEETVEKEAPKEEKPLYSKGKWA